MAAILIDLVVHNGFTGISPPRIPSLRRPGQSGPCSSSSSRYTVAIGSPTTFDQEPSIQSMKRDASPWIA